METVLKFLQDAQVFYIATVDGDQPRVRPFGAIANINGKLCTCTNITKNVYKQMAANPKIEISAMAEGKWIRLTATAVADDSVEAKTAMLEACPSLKNMYSADDGIFVVIAITDATAQICSFTEAPVEIKF